VVLVGHIHSSPSRSPVATVWTKAFGERLRTGGRRWYFGGESDCPGA
jgi:hypothetical protein